MTKTERSTIFVSGQQNIDKFLALLRKDNWVCIKTHEDLLSKLALWESPCSNYSLLVPTVYYSYQAGAQLSGALTNYFNIMGIDPLLTTLDVVSKKP